MKPSVVIKNLNKTFVNVKAGQANVAHRLPNSKKRFIKMMRRFDKRGMTIITFNEISTEQIHQLAQNFPGWGVHFVSNGFLNEHYSYGNAVVYRLSVWDLTMNGSSLPIEIDYRSGKKFGKKGSWRKRKINMAVVNLKHKYLDAFFIDVIGFHFPTKFNSNETSREHCARVVADFCKAVHDKGHSVIAGGDGNNIFPRHNILKIAHRDGPDAILTNGFLTVRGRSLPFKLRGLSNHNGVVAVVRFRLNG